MVQTSYTKLILNISEWFVRRNSIIDGRIRSSHYTSPSTQSQDSQTHTVHTGLLGRNNIYVISNSGIQKKKVIGFDGLTLDVNAVLSRTDGVVPQRSTIAEAPGRKLGQKKRQKKYRLCVCVADIMTD